MKILLDQNLPRDLRTVLRGHDVHHAGEMGWSELSNGQLLDAAEQAGFEILLTADKSIARQQRLHGRKLGLIALSNNYWPTLQIGAERILRALETASPGSHREVSLPRPRLHPSSRMPRRHDPS